MLLRKFLFPLALCLQLFTIALIAQPANFPVPPANPNQLFYLQRTPNTNTIVYELNLKNGKLNTDEPVQVFWLRYQENGQKQDLTFIQRKFAYGLRSKMLSQNQFELTFVSYKKFKIYLQEGADGKFHAYALIGKKKSLLQKVYLKIKEGGSFWSPNIEYVEIIGLDFGTGQLVKEQIKI